MLLYVACGVHNNQTEKWENCQICSQYNIVKTCTAYKIWNRQVSHKTWDIVKKAQAFKGGNISCRVCLEEKWCIVEYTEDKLPNKRWYQIVDIQYFEKVFGHFKFLLIPILLVDVLHCAFTEETLGRLELFPHLIIIIHTHHHHHHHHVVPLARISLTLSRHFSPSFITSGRSSGLYLVS